VLCLSVADTDVFYVYPDRLRLPLIFYYGHTACVYINKLVLAGLLKVCSKVTIKQLHCIVVCSSYVEITV